MFKSPAFKVLSTLLLTMVSCLTGMGYAMAAIAGAPEVPDDKGAGIDLTGTVASASQVRDGKDLAEPEIDTTIAKFRPYLFPLDTDIRTEMKQVSVKGYEVEHYASGSSILDCTTINGNVSSGASVNLNGYIGANDKIMFTKHATILVKGVNATKTVGADTVDCGEAVLFVTEKDASNITVECLNDGCDVPAIPQGTELSILSNACAESEMNVAPENYQPKPQILYLQKKIVNIVITDHFKEIIKKVPFFEQDLRDNALYNFRRKNARTAWIGKESKILRTQEDNMGQEYVYTSQGVLRQVNGAFSTASSQISYSDLIALTKMQFTKYSANNTARCYCGKGFMENLLNVDFQEHKDVFFTQTKDARNIEFSNFKTTFGTLEFVYDPTLDDLGYEDICVIIDVKNSVRYVKDDERTLQTDMKKGGTENREAKRDIVIQADAPALKGYNSIIVTLGSNKRPSIVNPTVLASAMSAIPTANVTDGMIVYLTQDWSQTISGVTVSVKATEAVTAKVASNKAQWFLLGGEYVATYNSTSSAWEKENI